MMIPVIFLDFVTHIFLPILSLVIFTHPRERSLKWTEIERERESVPCVDRFPLVRPLLTYDCHDDYHSAIRIIPLLPLNAIITD